MSGMSIGPGFERLENMAIEPSEWKIMPALPYAAPLTPEQRLEALKIAHETKNPEIRRAALALVCPTMMAVG